MSTMSAAAAETTNAQGNPLVEVRQLKKYFPLTKSRAFRRTTDLIKAVDEVSFSIRKGETMGLVGESGCGKTTTGMCILSLEQPTEGAVYYEGVNLSALSQRQLIPWRRRIQVIFQDPYSSLNPRMKVGEIIADPMRVHRLTANARQLRRRVAELLNVALSTKPEFIVCDEAVSALDVSIQAQIINLLEDLREEFHLTYLFISHDLSVVRHLCHQVVLLASIPMPDPEVEAQRDYSAVQGEIPSPINPPAGCVFHPRASRAHTDGQFAGRIVYASAPAIWPIKPVTFSWLIQRATRIRSLSGSIHRMLVPAPTAA